MRHKLINILSDVPRTEIADMYALACLSEVSHPTVMRYLRGMPIRPGLRARIERAQRQLDAARQEDA